MAITAFFSVSGGIKSLGIPPEYGNVLEYGVASEFRRRGFAAEMNGYMEQIFLSDGVTEVYLTPDPVTGAPFWKSAGYADSGMLDPDAQKPIYIKHLPMAYRAVPLTLQSTGYVAEIMSEPRNIDALHTIRQTRDEWLDVFRQSEDDRDEKNFLICREDAVCAWLKLNGLEDSDTAWIAMLVVSDQYKGQGVGKFSVRFAVDYLKSRGFTKIGIHTTEDNVPAQKLYKKCGFSVAEYGSCTTGDGKKRKGYTFMLLTET